jgi:MFS family permease
MAGPDASLPNGPHKTDHEDSIALRTESVDWKAPNAPESSVEPFEIETPPKKRSRLRITAIVVALYVYSTVLPIAPELISMQLSTFVFALDATIISTCLPTIAHDLDASSSYSWIGSSYLLAAAAASPLWSNWSNIWGRKPAMIITITIFFLSSIVCALSRTSGTLIAGRVLQGLGGGGINTLVYILISDIFSMR